MRYIRRLCLVAGAFLSIGCVACTSSYLQAGSPAELFSRGDPTSMQIGRKDGRIVVLLDPKIERDTVWGRGPGDQLNSTSGVALSDVDWAMARGERASVGKTIVVVGLLLLFAAGTQGF